MYALYEKIKFLKIIEPDPTKGTFLFQERFHFAVQYNIIHLCSMTARHTLMYGHLLQRYTANITRKLFTSFIISTTIFSKLATYNNSNIISQVN